MIGFHVIDRPYYDYISSDAYLCFNSVWLQKLSTHSKFWELCHYSSQQDQCKNWVVGRHYSHHTQACEPHTASKGEQTSRWHALQKRNLVLTVVVIPFWILGEQKFYFRYLANERWDDAWCDLVKWIKNGIQTCGRHLVLPWHQRCMWLLE